MREEERGGERREERGGDMRGEREDRRLHQNTKTAKH